MDCSDYRKYEKAVFIKIKNCMKGQVRKKINYN